MSEQRGADTADNVIISSARSYLEAEVAQRANHHSAEEVRTSCSFARAERLFGREYHGRFLIELLQNAADAWRNDPRSTNERSRLAVVVTEEPALLVANQGAPMTAEVVIESLGHIGASTKAEGEAIGYKGIGFKSVLEITLAPQIYSGLRESKPLLAVDFDPERALESIRHESQSWAELVRRVQGIDPDDDLAPVPVLRFPHWVDELPDEVAALAAQEYDTVVRLPFDRRFAERLGLDEEAWLTTVRAALNDVSDQILLLLGCFSEVRIEDRSRRVESVIEPRWDEAAEAIGGEGTREKLRIFRNGEPSSQWQLFWRTLPSRGHLAGEVAIGVRLEDHEGGLAVRSAVESAPSAPFHLFFPTRIQSGLPFLAHGYFEVDAARTGFYRGSVDRNRAILDELGRLAADAVADVVGQRDIDLRSLGDLVAGCGEPEDQLAAAFRAQVLDRLDEVAWVPLERDDKTPSSARPADAVATRPNITRSIARVFPPRYVKTRLGLGLPDTRLTDQALELFSSRAPKDRADDWELLAALFRPASVNLWTDVEADTRFHALLDLVDALMVEDRAAATALLDGLRGDPDTRLLPTVGAGGGRALLPIPDPREGAPGRRSRLVMARARAAAREALVPPDALDLAFIPEGLLASEADIDRAKPLGVRPFTVDNVLDRLNGIADAPVDPSALLRFVWQLFARERVSSFGTRRSVERAAVFDPSQWFWCQPGRAREDDTARLRQQRERYLAGVLLPARDGDWREAGTLAFGADWADWLTHTMGASGAGSAVEERASAYRALESVSPGEHTLLAPPDVVVPLLSGDALDAIVDENDDTEEIRDDRQRNAERHAFLLRLGVWEVPPLEAFESRDPSNRANFPWSGPTAARQRDLIEASGGWRFGLDGLAVDRHSNVYLAEDFRFQWTLEEAAGRDPESLSKALEAGARLYGERLGAMVFCNSCRTSNGSHRVPRHSTAADRYPSWLAIQLRETRWVACTLDGARLESTVAPAAAWWHPKPPAGAGLRQSPWRMLPLCSTSTGMGEELRHLARVNTFEDADCDVLRDLLVDLRSKFEQQSLPIDPSSSGTARQAFVSVHRLAYERLADLATQEPEEVQRVIVDTQVLCDLGEGLVYRPAAESRHDDGRFATYVRHFVGSVPLAVIPREREVWASRLGIPSFAVRLVRRGDDGDDVTDQLRALIGERIPELLSIVVNHSLGTQTLELSSAQFEERARRLQGLTVRQTKNLVIDVSVEGTQFRATLGVGSDQDVYLDSATSSAPVLYHDLLGVGWQDRLRRKIAPHLATILENPAYTHTFALFLQAESDAEREEFLLELGVSSEAVEVISARIGVVTAEERQRHLRWYRAILATLGHEPETLDLEPSSLTAVLADAGLEREVAQALADAGGGEAVRRTAGEGSPVRLLVESGLDLQHLNNRLIGIGDSGLSLSATKRSFARWIDSSGRQLAAVLSTRTAEGTAKAAVRSLGPSPSLALSIDANLSDVLEPVVALLDSYGLVTTGLALAERPRTELAHLGGFESETALDERTRLLFDEEEQARILRELAAVWRREIRLLALLARMGAAETRATIRALDETVRQSLPPNPARPSELVDSLSDLFAQHDALADALAERLDDSVTAQPPDRNQLLSAAEMHGVHVGRLDRVERALEAPRREHARVIKQRSERLTHQGLRPSPPAGLTPPPPTAGDRPRKSRKVSTVKVGEGQDRRKRELGDEGEQWALAAVVGAIMNTAGDVRERAIDEITELLRLFRGAPVETALSHAELAKGRDLDDEEIIDELTGLLHVSRHSDGFGFDLLGWLPSVRDGVAHAMCLEVKSGTGEAFHLSSKEWHVAREFHERGDGDQYAVLVVRRALRGGVPAGMDLLVDPVALVDAGYLRQEVDGFKIAYRAEQGRQASSDR